MSDLLSVFEGFGLGLILKGDLQKFVGTVFNKSAEEVSDCLKNQIKCFNAEKVTHTFVNVYKKLEQNNINPEPVIDKILFPLLEGISLESDENLQTKWEDLLASAASGEEIHPSYPKILSELSPLDAKALEAIENNTKNSPINEFALMTLLAPQLDLTEQFKEFEQDANTCNQILESQTDKFHQTDAATQQKSQTVTQSISHTLRKSTPSEECISKIKEKLGLIEESTDNLQRLNLIITSGTRRDNPAFLKNGHWGYMSIKLTSLGKKFLKAVSFP